MPNEKKFKGTYGKSFNENFTVIDSIGVPHPYCIGAAHLKYNDSMHFGAKQIRHMETHHSQVHCMVKGCTLSFDEHKQALLIECKIDIKDPDHPKQTCKELHHYLMSIKNETEKNGYTGFVFLDRRP